MEGSSIQENLETHSKYSIGINLVNVEWMRTELSSKSVSLGNSIDVYSKVR